MDIVSRQRINVLIHLADIQSIDSTAPEVGLIHRVADECNFSITDLKSLVKSPEPIASFGALSKNQKKMYMYSICELMAMIDVNNQKKLLCQKVAFDLEYNSNQVNKIVGKFQRNQVSHQPKDGTILTQKLESSLV